MLKSILGNKIGMTQIFDETGNMIPVTVINAGPCTVTGIRTNEKNGYTALQLGFGDIKEKALKNPVKGQFKKLEITPKKYLREFRVDDVSAYKIGQEIKADLFKAGDYVDISGVSKGKGFAGGVKRYHFKGGVQTHGQSDRQRAPGSIGSQGPQHVLKGMRMAGHMGNVVITTQKLKVVKVDNEKNLILINGAVPGVNGNMVVVNKTVKKVSTAIPDVQKKPQAKKKEVKKEAPKK
ncbi:MAG: 50S ribosomal protein L3 [Elusimicrobia bacterium]|nr:50S ribosomal protein L3 [Candidatus Liberimonas magnetica]